MVDQKVRLATEGVNPVYFSTKFNKNSLFALGVSRSFPCNPVMNEIELPGTGVQISQAVFGTSRLGGTFEAYNKSEGKKILLRALEAGITTFDTADLYAQGRSEMLLGETLQKHRDEVLLATKGGYVLSNKMKFLSRLKPLARKFIKRGKGLAGVANRVRAAGISQNFSADYLTKAVENSLRRLQTDRVDIYQLHSPDLATLEGDEVFEVMQGLKEAGKIRSYGASLLSWEHLHVCLGKGLSFIQVEADLLGRQECKAELKRASEDGIVVTARQPFASGLLARDPGSWAVDDFGGDQDRLMRARKRAEKLRDLGDPFSLILRYLVHHSNYPSFLFATTQMDHLKRNLDAINLPPLEAAELEIFN